ncbi:uncharacterized protein LOC130015537 [Mercurialis annua]|uniref:uncharacterized protein LOC130015537 n=1 Tax=Mercurialis annua TaxID=3986 RepID=UPI0024AD3253|nr:uncharacterized protein LOC130015537 [Mercurialis annua]
MNRGVRQGDPISPMLFILDVEGLTALIEKAVILGLLDGIHVEGYMEPISILQFANDTLLFVPNDMWMIKNLLRILRCFELVYGLEINYHKSSIIGINVDDQSLAEASSIFSCKIEVLPIVYLVLHLSLSLSRSLPVYYLCSLSTPNLVVNSLKQLMRRFLWNGPVTYLGFSKVSGQNSGFKNWFDLEDIEVRRLSHLRNGIFSACIKNSQVWDLFLSHLSSSVGIGENIFV